MSKIKDIVIDDLNHSFNASEENANDRMKEELQFALINDLKMARQAEGILTLNDIANCIEEGLGYDAKVLGGLLYIKGKAKPADTILQSQKFMYGELNKAFGI
jgi:hypothetical protein